MTVSRGVAISWAALVGLTVAFVASMRLAHVPGALMLGPMFAAIVVAIRLPGARLPPQGAVVAQAALGCLIAHALSPHLLADLAPRWPLLVGANLALMLGIAGFGYMVTRAQWLPGTSGVWGMSPGAAGAMVLLSEAYGADKRLVAVMQYLRLLCAALVVVILGALLGRPHTGAPAIALPGAATTPWLAPVHGPALAVTISLIVVGFVVARLTRKAQLAIFIPIFGGVAVQFAGAPAPEVPALLGAAAFGFIGWHVGLSFTREALMHTAQLLPRILAVIAAILLLCAGLSLILARLAHVSFLTAYMALNPGGTDVVMILAASIAVDLPLILAMQISRLVLVVVVSPTLGRLAAGRHMRAEAPSHIDDPADRLAKDVDAAL